MHWVLLQSSWDHKAESLVLQGVHAGTDGKLVLCGGFVGRELPLYLSEDLTPYCERRFRLNEVLTEDGKVVAGMTEGAIPLYGLTAAWAPNLPEMLSELLNC